MKRIFILLAMAGIYVWIRRKQRTDAASDKTDRDAEAGWANEGGNNPAPSV